jgi:hypothetical protein
MLVVMLAIGTTDLLFALDSIPAIFGLTKEPFLVFTSNAFALMGLRQLYFLLGGLLNRLVYLDIGLAVILAFIGVKLILEALHGEGVTWAPEIGIVPSLAVIVVVLGVTTALSLLKVRRDPSAVRQLPKSRPPSPPPVPASDPATAALTPDPAARAAQAAGPAVPAPPTDDAAVRAQRFGDAAVPAPRSGDPTVPSPPARNAAVPTPRAGDQAARSDRFAPAAGDIPADSSTSPGAGEAPADSGSRDAPAGRPTGPARASQGDHPPARPGAPVEQPPRRSSGGGPPRPFERGRPAPVSRSDLPADGH